MDSKLNDIILSMRTTQNRVQRILYNNRLQATAISEQNLEKAKPHASDNKPAVQENQTVKQ